MRRPIDTLELACFGWSRESLYCLALLPPSSILQVLLGIERLVFTVELHSVSCSMLNYMSHPSLIAISTRTQLQQSCVQCCGGTVQHLWSAKVWNSIDICSPREGHSGYTSFKVQDQRDKKAVQQSLALHSEIYSHFLKHSLQQRLAIISNNQWSSMRSPTYFVYPVKASR